MNRKIFAMVAYSLILACAAAACFRKPIFEDQFDILPYVGAIEMNRTSDLQLVHAHAYEEAKASMSREDFANLTRNPNGYRQDIATNYLHFAELMPFYNIRVLYIEAASLLHFGPLRLSAITAIVLISALSYAGMGVTLFIWILRYMEAGYAALFSSLLMLSAPLMKVGRTPTPDAFSGALVLLALYWGIEKRWTFGCLLVLLVSIFVRTDNVILAWAMIGYFVVGIEKQRRIRVVYGGVLLVLAAGSMVVINRFSGNYGWQTLFYNSFVAGIPNPAEAVVHVSPRQYVAQLAMGHFSKTSSMMLFLVIGVIGVLALSRHEGKTRAVRDIAAILIMTSAVRYLLFPTFWDRHYAAMYLFCSIAMLAGVAPALGIEAERSVAAEESHGKSGIAVPSAA